VISYTQGTPGVRCPILLETGWQVSRFGAGVLGEHQMNSNLLRNIAMAVNVYDAFTSRSRATSWAEWAKVNPRHNDLLAWVEGNPEDNDG